MQRGLKLYEVFCTVCPSLSLATTGGTAAFTLSTEYAAVCKRNFSDYSMNPSEVGGNSTDAFKNNKQMKRLR